MSACHRPPWGFEANPLSKDVLLAMEDDGALRRVRVRPLNHSEVSELIRSRLQTRSEDTASPGVIPEALVQWLNERSLGHPLFLLSLLEALLDEGADLTAPHLTRVPTSLRDRIGAELSMLEPDVRAVLEVLAVIDRKATPSELSAVLEAPLEEVGRLLEELHDTRLIVEESDRAGFTYEITHPLIQEATYELIGGARRMALHRAVARVLLDQGQSGAAAAHYARSISKADDETIDALCRAISEAERKGLYRETLAILGELPDLIEAGDPRWLTVFDAIAWQADWVVDHLAEGDALEAIEAMRRIEEVARRHRDQGARGIVRFHLASFLAIGAGRLEEAQDACQRAIDLFQEAGERRRALLAKNELVWITSCAGELERARALAEAILADADEKSDAMVVNQTAGSLAYALALMGRFEEAHARYESAQRIALDEGMSYRRIWGLVQQSLMWTLQGRLNHADSVLQEAINLDYTKACDALALERLAFIRWLEGRLTECLRLIEESGARRAVRGSRRRAWGLALAARAHLDLGHATRARRLLEQARETYTEDDILDWSAWCDWSEGYLRRQEGDVEAAIALYEAAAGRYRKMKAAAVEAMVLVDLAEAAFEDRNLAILSKTSLRIDEIAEQVGSRWHEELAILVAALKNLMQGSADGSRLVATSERLQDLGYNVLAATAAHYAGIALTAPEPDHAMRMFEKSARLAAEFGAIQQRDRSIKRLSGMGAAGRQLTGAILGPESLTPRERDVALLAARGLTARQIADQLFIGTRTVESHLAHVYPKLGVDSKRELIIRASELGLIDDSA